ncbi:PAS domain-containing protein [Leptolyngbya sp. 15MV]|nr:PAS domain-containing protein [Leptolyngbya sp. 15MV]
MDGKLTIINSHHSYDESFQMRLREVKELVDGTAEPAFALDHNGQIAAWNKAAKQTFGFDSAEAIGQFCSDGLYGVDECGMECSTDCAIRHRAEKREPLKSYDIQLAPSPRAECADTARRPPGARTRPGWSC